jgi:hypothetical protein
MTTRRRLRLLRHKDLHKKITAPVYYITRMAVIHALATSGETD